MYKQILIHEKNTNPYDFTTTPLLRSTLLSFKMIKTVKSFYYFASEAPDTYSSLNFAKWTPVIPPRGNTWQLQINNKSNLKLQNQNYNQWLILLLFYIVCCWFNCISKLLQARITQSINTATCHKPKCPILHLSQDQRPQFSGSMWKSKLKLVQRIQNFLNKYFPLK
jgi:hypothetical protein